MKPSFIKSWLMALLLPFLLCSSSYSQTATPMPLTYRLKAYAILQECDSEGKKIEGHASITIPGGSSFTITKSLQDKTYIIEFWDWSDYPQGTPDNLRLKDDKLYLSDNNTPYKIKVKDPNPPKKQPNFTEKDPSLSDKEDILESGYYKYNSDPTTGVLMC